MINRLKSKKGVSLVELIAAIVIIGLASTTITTMMMTSMRGQANATQYLLAKEVANTYNTIFCRDIQRANLETIGAAALTSTDPDDKYLTVSQELLRNMTKVGTDDSQTYNFLYDPNSTFTLNGQKFDSAKVTIRIQLISIQVGIRTEVIVSYANNRTVTSNGTQFFI